MPNIYISNETGHNYGLAKEITGQDSELIAVTRGKLDSRKTDQLLFEVAEAIHDSSPDDYLILTGPPLINFVVGAAWIAMHKRANILVWDAFRSRYSMRSLDVPQIQHVIERASEANDE